MIINTSDVNIFRPRYDSHIKLETTHHAKILIESIDIIKNDEKVNYIRDWSGEF